MHSSTRWVIAALLAAVSGSPAMAQSPQPPASGTPPALLIVQAPVVKPQSFLHRFPQGSRIVLKANGKAVVNLTPRFFAADHPRVSPRGRRILFAGQRRAGSHWQVWEMNADGTAQRQITHCAGDCLQAAYLPDGQLAYTAVAAAGAEIRVSRRDGTGEEPVTFGPGGFHLQTVLANGRLLVSARWPLRAPEAGAIVGGTRELYTLHPDGTDLSILRDARAGTRRGEAIETADGTIVFVESAAHGPRHERLMRLQPGAVQPAAFGETPSGLWQPARLGPHQLVVARRDGSGRFNIYRFDPSRGITGRPLDADAALSSVEVTPLQAQPPAWRYWSVLKLLNPPAYQARRGQLVALDSTLSADATGGRLTTPIARVRVLGRDAVTGAEAVLGTAPVASDGSFYIEVPADHALRFELLDSAGKVIHAQRSWIWVRPDEQRGCVGCHESRALAPPNRWPLILRRQDVPTQLGPSQSLQGAH